MLVIGIAGGVASGKSLVADCFQHFGAEILDADRAGHEALKNPDVIESIVSHWGKSVLKDGKIDRRALGKIVFDPTPTGADSLKTLEEITHPLIGKTIRQELDELKSRSDIPAAVLDAPIMFKANWDQLCDKIVFVNADVKVRQKRARERGWDTDELEKRESRQTPIEEKQSRSTDFINNSKSKEETYLQARDLWRAWKLKLPNQLESPKAFFNK